MSNPDFKYEIGKVFSGGRQMGKSTAILLLQIEALKKREATITEAALGVLNSALACDGDFAAKLHALSAALNEKP